MNSDSSNIDPGTTKPNPVSHSGPTRHSAWGDIGDVEIDMPATPLGIAWSGIVLSAACFPVVLMSIQLIQLRLVHGVGFLTPDGLGVAFGFLSAGALAGLVYGIIMSIPAFFLTRLLRWSLKGVISERAASGIYGGLTGFLCTTFGGLSVAFWAPHSRIQDLLVSFLFSLLAVVMGHAGAVLAGYRRRNDGFPFFEPIFTLEKQITISYMMKLTLIVAVLAVIFKAAGSFSLHIGVAWAIYLLVQTLLLVGENWVTRWLRRG